MGEPTKLEIDEHETMQPPVEEYKVHPIPFIPDSQALLSCNKSKLATKLQKEILKMPDERVFEVGLGVFVLEAEEFEHIGVLYLLLRRHFVFLPCSFTLLQHRGLIFR